MTDNGGRAHFDLGFAQNGAGRSFLATQFVRYPFHVCRGMYLTADDDRVCSVTLQSTSGGLFEGDRTVGRVAAAASARVEVSTSASTIVHSMDGDDASQAVHLEAAAGSLLAYLPQPVILFPKSSLRSAISVRAHPSAMVIFSESFLTHDPQAGRRAFDVLDSRVIVHASDDTLLAKDRQLMQGAAWHNGAIGVAGRHTAYASVWLVRRGVPKELLHDVRRAMDSPSSYGGASWLPHGAGLQVRLLCTDAIELKQTLERVMSQLRRATPPALQPEPQLEIHPERMASA